MMAELLKDERDREEERGAVSLEKIQEFIDGPKAARNDLGASGENSRTHKDRHPVDVEEGKLIEKAIPWPYGVGLYHLVQVGQKVVVGEHDTLGQTGGPAGEGEDSQGFSRVDPLGAIQPPVTFQ